MAAGVECGYDLVMEHTWKKLISFPAGAGFPSANKSIPLDGGAA